MGISVSAGLLGSLTLRVAIENPCILARILASAKVEIMVGWCVLFLSQGGKWKEKGNYFEARTGFVISLWEQAAEQGFSQTAARGNSR